MMDKLVSDDIPNIRFNVAKSYSVLIDVLKKLPEHDTLINLEKAGKPADGCEKGHALITEQIIPNLEKLKEDEDVDVRYFATTAAQSFEDAMQT